jgi:hypothetical protein
MYRYADGILKNYLSLKQDAQNFVSHTWLSDERLIVGNNRAELFLVQNCEILSEYKIYDFKENERFFLSFFYVPIALHRISDYLIV